LPVLPGSAEAEVIWGGIVKRLVIAYFIDNIYAKKISKSGHICQSYSKPTVTESTWKSLFTFCHHRKTGGINPERI